MLNRHMCAGGNRKARERSVYALLRGGEADTDLERHAGHGLTTGGRQRERAASGNMDKASLDGFGQIVLHRVNRTSRRIGDDDHDRKNDIGEHGDGQAPGGEQAANPNQQPSADRRALMGERIARDVKALTP